MSASLCSEHPNYAIAREWIDGVRYARRPPTTWEFVAPLTQFLASHPTRNEPCSPDYTERERAHWRSFCEWHRLVRWEIAELVDVLVWLHRNGKDDDLWREVGNAALRAHERYRSWLLGGEIEWMPKQFTLRGDRREQCNAVEYLGDALLAVGL